MLAALITAYGDGRWIEQLDHNSEVVRVFCRDGRYLWRVSPHRDRFWIAEHRLAGPCWTAIRERGRGPYKAAPARRWRSPEAAMRAVEKEFLT